MILHVGFPDSIVLDVGFFRNGTHAETTFLPCLTFFLQVAAPPSVMKQLQDLAMRRLLPGPGNWITWKDALVLKSRWGWAVEFDNLEELSLAIKIRVCLEVAPDARQMLHEHRRAMSRCETVLHPLHEWLACHHFSVLASAMEEFGRRGLSTRVLQNDCQTRPHKSLQRRALGLIKEQGCKLTYKLNHRIREKLWKIACLASFQAYGSYG